MGHLAYILNKLQIPVDIKYNQTLALKLNRKLCCIAHIFVHFHFCCTDGCTVTALFLLIVHSYNV